MPIDGSGIKAAGEGSKRGQKTVRRLFPGDQESSPEIRAAALTTSGLVDAPMLPELRDRFPPEQEIARTESCARRIASGRPSGDDAATLPGQRQSAWDFDRQMAQFQVRGDMLNGVTARGIPVAKVSGQVCPEDKDSPDVGRLVNRARAEGKPTAPCAATERH